MRLHELCDANPGTSTNSARVAGLSTDRSASWTEQISAAPYCAKPCTLISPGSQVSLWPSSLLGAVACSAGPASSLLLLAIQFLLESLELALKAVSILSCLAVKALHSKNVVLRGEALLPHPLQEFLIDRHVGRRASSGTAGSGIATPAGLRPGLHAHGSVAHCGGLWIAS